MEALTQREISEIGQKLFSIESQSPFEEEIYFPQKQYFVAQKNQRKNIKSYSYPQNSDLGENLERNSQQNSQILEKQHILFRKYSNYSAKMQKNKIKRFYNKLNQIQFQNKRKTPSQNEEIWKQQNFSNLESYLNKKQHEIQSLKRKIFRSQWEDQNGTDEIQQAYQMNLQLDVKEKQIQQRINELIRKINYDESHQQESAESIKNNQDQEEQKINDQESNSKLSMLSSFLENSQNVIMYAFLIIISIILKSLY